MKAFYIFWKEFRGYLTSPISYVITGTYLTIIGFLFSSYLIESKRVDFFPQVLGNMVFLLLFVTPALTMRLLAEERKQRTVALLFTSPVATWEIVVGKFLACLGYLTCVFLVTGIYPLVLMRYGEPDLWMIGAAYLGALLCTAALVSIGVFTSSLSDSQMMAAILAFGISLFFWLVQFSDQFLRRNASEGLATLVRSMSIHMPFWQFLSGAVHLKHVVFYLSFIAFFLYLATRKLSSNAWR